MKKIIFETTFSKYFSEEIIGQGGSGKVYKVLDESGNPYAIKILDPERATSKKRKRFKNEVTFSLRNKHPNIISIVDHGLYKANQKVSPFYVMPIYKSSLRKLLATGISQGKVLPYFAQILHGVEAAHLQGVFHRDLKPENVLYDPKSDRLLIADFGIAHFSEDELYTLVETKSHERLANFQYAAYEQKMRGKPVDHRADIFALGLMLNEMFTGEIPHGTNFKTISSVASEFAYLDNLVLEMLQQSSANRPASIEAIKQELKARGLEYVENQKLSKLKQTVIPVTDIDDPLISDPPRIIETDWDGKTLTLFFSQDLNPKWNWALCNFGSHSAVYRKGPEMFRISENKAAIDCSGDDAQRIIDYFKYWLPRVNQVYEETIRREKREKEERERLRLKQQVEAQEQLLRVRKNLKI
jgi:serine/threonine protein kinase